MRPPVEADPRDAYHALIPLPALSPVPRPSSRSIEEQCVNERAYRTLLVQGALAVLLPTEDLENECLTSLVGQIFSETVIGGVVANKASEPWVIWTGLTLLADIIRKNTSSKAVSRVGKSTKDATAATTTSTKAQTGWHDDAKDLPDAAGGQGGQGGGITARAQRMLWFAIHCLFLAISAMRVLVRTVVVSRSLPSRLYRSIGPKGDMSGHSSDGRQSIDAAMMREQARPPQLLLPPHALAKQPVLEFKVWACMASVIELDARMPWLAGSLSMLQWLLVNAPGRIAAMDGILDR